MLILLLANFHGCCSQSKFIVHCCLASTQLSRERSFYPVRTMGHSRHQKNDPGLGYDTCKHPFYPKRSYCQGADTNTVQSRSQQRCCSTRWRCTLLKQQSKTGQKASGLGRPRTEAGKATPLDLTTHPASCCGSTARCQHFAATMTKHQSTTLSHNTHTHSSHKQSKLHSSGHTAHPTLSSWKLLTPGAG